METEPPLFGNDDDDEMRVVPMSDDDDDNNEAEGENAPVENETDRSTVIKPKRVVKNPQPKLDAARLMGPRGIVMLQSTMKDFKFKGKGHEKEDLSRLMRKLEHWCHRMYPRRPFRDSMRQIQKLGSQKIVKNMMDRIRLDMFQSDELSEQPTNTPEDEARPAEPDIFDELLGLEPNDQSCPPSSGDRLPADFQPQTAFGSQLQAVSSPLPAKRALSAEQRERIERNRMMALEKRKAKTTRQEEQNKNRNPEIDDGLDEEVGKKRCLTPLAEVPDLSMDEEEKRKKLKTLAVEADYHDHTDEALPRPSNAIEPVPAISNTEDIITHETLSCDNQHEKEPVLAISNKEVTTHETIPCDLQNEKEPVLDISNIEESSKQEVINEEKTVANADDLNQKVSNLG